MRVGERAKNEFYRLYKYLSKTRKCSTPLLSPSTSYRRWSAGCWPHCARLLCLRYFVFSKQGKIDFSIISLNFFFVAAHEFDSFSVTLTPHLVMQPLKRFLCKIYTLEGLHAAIVIEVKMKIIKRIKFFSCVNTIALCSPRKYLQKYLFYSIELNFLEFLSLFRVFVYFGYYYHCYG